MRHLVRLFQRRPLFAGFLTITLALGLGAATAMFSVLDGVLLRPLPYPAADRLLTVWQMYPNWRDRASSIGWDAPSILGALWASVERYQKRSRATYEPVPGSGSQWTPSACRVRCRRSGWP